MIAPAFDDEQRAALDAPGHSGLVAVTGEAGTGKTHVLLARAARAATAQPILLTAPTARGVQRLAEIARAQRLPAPRSLASIALDILEQAGRPARLIDDARASYIFESVGAELFALDWTELVSWEIDPEITGLRAPERFSAAAFRLIRKLRAARYTPDGFVADCKRAAMQFYGNPPNFSSPDLLGEVKEKYRDSLRVGSVELERQHQREIDLIKILGCLFASYVSTIVASGCLTATDALFEATAVCEAQPEIAQAMRARLPAAFVDDAQDLTLVQLALLRALYGGELRDVTFAGDGRQATRTLQGALGLAPFERAAARFELQTMHRSAPAIASVARFGGGTARPPMLAPAENAVEVYRASDKRAEARYVAQRIAELVREGPQSDSIAIVARDLSCAQGYIDAVLDCDITLDLAGDANLFEFRPVQDGLAALWSIVDPFRHDWLLRNLEAPWLALGDASIAALCAQPANAQPLLFELPGDAVDEERPRSDRGRDLRLGRAVTRGDADADLPPEALLRVQAFRAARERWEQLERELTLGELVRAVLGETVSATLRPGARGTFERGLVQRLIALVDDYSEREPLGMLDEFLAYAQDLMETEADLLTVDAVAHGDGEPRVWMLDVEAAKGREFDHVFVVDVRAGAFPRYYVPDAFLFTRKFGIIPKENVGEGALAARTAKFTYATTRLDATGAYNNQERRAFACAASRARKRLYLSAGGPATRGVNTPEILEEIAAARLPGVERLAR